jgi:hypothetical protein
MDLASDFADGVSLEIQWARGSRRESQSDVIPDEERPANEQMTPAALLASIGTIEVRGKEIGGINYCSRTTRRTKTQWG